MKAGTLTRWLTRGYVWWLQFLRYANWIEMVGAHYAGNFVSAAWQSARIADLDKQIDELSISVM